MEQMNSRKEGGGPIGSFPLSKLKIILLDCEVDPEQSNEMAFSIAAGEAFEAALQKGGPVLLEPIMKLTITTPDEYYGSFVGDLSQRRARIVSTNNRELCSLGNCVINVVLQPREVHFVYDTRVILILCNVRIHRLCLLNHSRNELFL